MRVHILISSLNWGGAETLLADYAVGARRAGIEVTVGYLAGHSQSAGRLRKLGIEPELVEISSLISPSDRSKVRDHLARVSPDLLHTHLGTPDFVGGLAARSLGIPSIATLHVMEVEPTLRANVKERLTSVVRRRCAFKVIAVSDAARRFYLDHMWDRPDHVVTVHNGIAGEVRGGAGPAIRTELGLRPDDLVVAMVGVLREGKGHEIAKAAVATLRQRFPRLRLLIVGDGPIRPEIEEMVAELGNAAIMTGFRDDVLDVLDATDVVLHPSHVDALPTALIEAMAARVPVLATDVGGIPEIVVPGETGVLVSAPPDPGEVAEALGRLLGDDEMRRRMGNAGHQRFEERFNLDAWISQLSGLYQEALGAGVRRGAEPAGAAPA